MLLTLAAFVVVIGVLIFVHEAGHFLAAKAVGIQVLRFSLGFGKPVVSVRRGETEYCIAWLPVGGYVKMAGLEEEGIAGELEGGKAAVPIDPARAFDRQPIWARMIVILAGVTMNVVLAFCIYAGIAATIGSPELATTQIDSVSTAALPPGARSLATLAFGDRIVRINGDTIRTWNDILDHISKGPTEIRFGVAGRAEPLAVNLAQGGGGLRPRQALAEALVPLVPPKVGLVEPGRPAIRAGIRPGDLIVRANGDTIRSWSDVLHAVWRSPGKPLRLDLLRDGVAVRLIVVPESRIESDSTSPRPRVYGAIGASQDPPTVHVREPLGRALVSGWSETATRALVVLGLIKGLILGQLSVREVGGPILVGQISGQMARLGFDWFLTFIAFFSINLAILNLLPIPILDGGQVVFLVAEAVRRKPLSVELRTRLTQVGFAVLLGIMALALTNDVLRVFPR